MSNKRKVLEDHRKNGKTFIAPFNEMGFSDVDYVTNILPELVWLQFLILNLGLQRGIDVSIWFINSASGLRSWGDGAEFSFISCFKKFSESDWNELLIEIKKSEMHDDLISSLTPFVRLFPEGNPFARIVSCHDGYDDDDLDLGRIAIANVFNRWSEEASILQVLVLYSMFCSEKLKISSDIPFPDLNSVFVDFNSESSERACSFARTTVTSSFAFYKDKIGNSWASSFWNRGSVLSPLDIVVDQSPTGSCVVSVFASDYRLKMQNTLKEIWGKLPINLYQGEVFEVIGALLARQCNLSTRIAVNPGVWDFHVGPLFLRAMVDCHINIAWVLKDPLNRARQFISYGLGQEKLQIEHLKRKHSELVDNHDRNSLLGVIKIREAWVDSQRFLFLQNVDVGSWSGMNTRKMAQEADCEELYDFAYVPWSSAAHGIWNHVAQFDAKPSQDPYHKKIRQPFFFNHQDVDVLVKATKYLDKSFVAVVQQFEINMSGPPVVEWFNDRMNRLMKESGVNKTDAE